MKAYLITSKNKYKIGKFYKSIYGCDFHYRSVINEFYEHRYYSPEDFELLEIEVLGEMVKYSDTHGMTNKIKIIRVVSYNEYSKDMMNHIPLCEYNSEGLVISKTYSDGRFYRYVYECGVVYEIDRNGRTCQTKYTVIEEVDS